MCLPKGEGVIVEREWTAFGLQCAVTQVAPGCHRCGYVRVPPGHLLHGVEYSFDNAVGALSAHGGVNFAEIEPCTEHEDGQGWWFGFDFSHAWDAMFAPDFDPAKVPQIRREMWEIYSRAGSVLNEGHYWTQAEVEAEVERLAEQLVEVAA
jgi:hypothetical protein